MKDELPKVVLTGLILGVTAALVVWFLERFEVARLHTEIREYLANYDAFEEWRKAGGTGPAEQGT